MNRKQSNYLACFSPPVMIVTFLIEIMSALFILWRYRSNVISWIIVALLICLGTFQYAEFMVCEGALGLSRNTWSRIGYACITMLPPLGVHLLLELSGKKHEAIKMLTYALGVCFAAFFLFMPQSVGLEVCTGNYVIFAIPQYSELAYMLYYYISIVVAAAMAYRWRSAPKAAGRRRAIAWLMIGYIGFIAPTTIVNLIDPVTIAGIPSIMCGFAVILALCLLLGVAPNALKARKDLG